MVMDEVNCVQGQRNPGPHLGSGSRADEFGLRTDALEVVQNPAGNVAVRSEGVNES